jgi:class 3 adenylate cyclase
VNIAARVRELAREGSILLSADSVVRGLDEFVLEDIGEHSLKNVMHPIRIYRLVGEANKGVGGQNGEEGSGDRRRRRRLDGCS